MAGLGVPEIIIILMIFAIPLLGVALIVRSIQSARIHKERLAAIEKGGSIPNPGILSRNVADERIYLLRGLIWLFVGIALTLALLGISLTTERPKDLVIMEQRANWAITGASQDDIDGALKNIGPQYAVPPALCLFGLVPIGVGLAYLLFHRAESRRMPKG